MQHVSRVLVLTDLVDSTKLVSVVGDARAAALNVAVDRISRDLLAARGGLEIDKTDGFLFLFESASAALAYCLDLHVAMAELSATEGITLATRAGIHAGTVGLRENPPEDVARGAKPLEVEGLAKPLAARVMGLARGGQTLCTETVGRLVDDHAGSEARWVDHGRWRLKGVGEPVQLWEVGQDGIAPFRAPPDGEKAWRAIDGPFGSAREGLRRAWSHRPLRAVVAAIAAGALVSAVYAWDQGRLKTAEYAEARWSPEMLVGFGEPVPGQPRVRVTTRGGRTVSVEELTSFGGPRQARPRRLANNLAFGASLLLEPRGAEIDWTAVEAWRSGATFVSTRQRLEYDEDGALIRVVHQRPGGFPAGSAAVERRDGGGLRLRWLDTLGTPSASPVEDVAVEELDFDAEGRLVERRFRNVSGVQPSAAKLGYFGERRRYDGLGRVVSTVRLDEQGRPTDTRAGFSEERRGWHGDTLEPASLAWFDARGEPAVGGGGGCATVTFGLGGSPETCLDETGAPALMHLDPVGALRCHVADHQDDGTTRRSTCRGLTGEPRGVQIWERNALGHTVRIRIEGEDGALRPGEQVWAVAVHHVEADGHLSATPRFLDAREAPYLPNDTYKGHPQDYRADHPMAYVHDAYGLSSARFVNADGDEVDGPYGYSRLDVRRDAGGRVVELALFDTEGHPAEMTSGVHRLTYGLDELGRPVATSRFAANGAPAFDSFGVHRDEMVWDPQGRLLRQAWFDAEGPMNKPPSYLRGGGNHAVEITYDERGLPREVAYRTADGAHPQGGRAAWEIFTHDARGDWTGFAVFGADGEAIMAPGRGVHRVHVLATPEGELIDVTGWGPEGEPLPVMMGCHRITGEFDVRGRLEVSRCLDGEGQPHPFAGGAGVAIWHGYDDSGHLNELRWEDAEGRLVAGDAGGMARILLQLDDAGRVREATTHGADGARIARAPRGAATSSYTYDQGGHVVEAEFLGADGAVIGGGKGHIVCERNAIGTPVAWTWLDADGSMWAKMTLDVAPTQHARRIQFENGDGGVVDGRHGWARVDFDRHEDVVEARYVDASGQPAWLGGPTTWRGYSAGVPAQASPANGNDVPGADYGFGLFDAPNHAELPSRQGWSGWRVTLDDALRVVRRTYLDGEGRPVVPTDPGYATKVVSWDDRRKVGVRYLDAHGEPMAVCGVHRMAREGWRWSAFDLEDRAVEVPEDCRVENGVRVHSPAVERG